MLCRALTVANSPLSENEVLRILGNLRSQEARLCPPASLINQLSITCVMRVTLVDWLYGLKTRFRFSHECFFLSINYLDRILSGTINITERKLQLVGAACFFIAAKFEEVWAPLASEIVERCDGAYDVKDLFHMEQDILGGLAWMMNAPTSPSFLDCYISLFELQMVSLFTQDLLFLS